MLIHTYNWLPRYDWKYVNLSYVCFNTNSYSPFIKNYILGTVLTLLNIMSFHSIAFLGGRYYNPYFIGKKIEALKFIYPIPVYIVCGRLNLEIQSLRFQSLPLYSRFCTHSENPCTSFVASVFRAFFCKG